MAGTANMKYQLLLPLQSKAKVQEFLKAIHKEFVSSVNPLESGLQDRLIQCGVLTDTDTESLEGGHLPTRAEKARRLWHILYDIDHEVFNRDVLPVLCEMYSYIISARFWRIADSTGPGSTGVGVQEGASAPPSPHDSPEKCTRCVMQNRIRAVTLADFLFRIGVITYELYRQLTKNIRTSEPDWHTLFGAFARLPRPAAMRHEQELTTLLQRHSLHVPENLVDLMTRGFPCQCPQLPACGKVDSVTMSAMTKKRLAMLFHLGRLRDRRSSDTSIASEASSSSSVYPPSESEDGSHVTFYTESLMSESSEVSVDEATDAGISSRSVRQHRVSAGNSRTEIATDLRLMKVSRFVDSVGTRTLPRWRGSITSSTQNLHSNKFNTWQERKRSRGSIPIFLSGENLQGTPSRSQESLVSAVLNELGDAADLSDADGSSDAGAETGDVGESTDCLATGRSSDRPCTGREPQPDSIQTAPHTERQDKPRRVDNERAQTGREHPSSLATKADVYHTFPRRSAKKTARLSDLCDRVSENKAQRESESYTSPAQPPQTNTKSSSEDSPVSEGEAFSPRPEANFDVDSSTSDSAGKLTRTVQTPTSLSLTGSTPELTASFARQGSGDRTSPLSSPAYLLPSELSPDDEKFKHVSKALYKGNYERHHLVLQGTLPSNTNDCVSTQRQDDDVKQEEESELLQVSDGVPVEYLSQYSCETLAVEHTCESEALVEHSKENSGSSFDDVMCGAAERARQNTDLQEFLHFTSNDVTTAEQMTQLSKKAIIVDVSARERVALLLKDYRDLEHRYTELRQRLDTSQQSGAQGEQNPALPPLDNPHPALSEVFQLCWQMLDLCEDMLILRRTFILCKMYLNTLSRLTSESTRDKADTVVFDAMVLLEETSIEAWQRVRRLDELTKELPKGSVSSDLPAIIFSMRTFLESS